jgi:predicted ATP-binding protein involved in virulence
MTTKPLPDLDPSKGYLMSLTLKNIRCFGTPAETLSLTKHGSETQPARWTVILGANGVGKTTVLRALALLNKERFLRLSGLNGDSLIFQLWRNKHVTTEIRIKYSDDHATQARLDFAVDAEGTLKVSNLNRRNDVKVAGFGAGRSWRNSAEESSEPTETLFNRDAQVRDPSETLFRFDYREKSENSNGPSRFQAFKKALTSGILPDVQDLRMGFAENDRPIIEFQTPDGWIALDDMSWGYQVFAAFAADYASRLIEWYPDSKTPLAEPGICLVDELDLHMHPSWQRKVIDDLSNIFPATQFIVTVHSPLVVQAAEDANLAVLKRDPNDPSKVQIHNDVEAIKGWRIDQVLTSDLFGLESSRPPSVVKALDERASLLAENAPTPEQQARLDALEAEAMDLPSAATLWEEEARALVLRAAERLKSGT